MENRKPYWKEVTAVATDAILHWCKFVSEDGIFYACEMRANVCRQRVASFGGDLSERNQIHRGFVPHHQVSLVEITECS